MPDELLIILKYESLQNTTKIFVRCEINIQLISFRERSGDIIARPTRMLQFWSELQQTWHIHNPMPQEQL
jgi:hypothetical protein